MTGEGHEAYITKVLSRDTEEEENGEQTIETVLIGEARKQRVAAKRAQNKVGTEKKGDGKKVVNNSERAKEPDVVKKASTMTETTVLKRRVRKVAKGNNRVWEAVKVYEGEQESKFRVIIEDDRILKVVMD